MADSALRIAVVGSGPAGFYAAGALLDAEVPIEVDMIERLPTPWGLVRLGVAPDHPKLKSVSRAFERIAEKPGFRFLGNVEVGRDLSHADLVSLYRSFKNDLPTFNDNPAWVLPMPARYVIGRDGIIAYAEVNPDYTQRPDPSELLPVLDRLQAGKAA